MYGFDRLRVKRATHSMMFSDVWCVLGSQFLASQLQLALVSDALVIAKREWLGPRNAMSRYGDVEGGGGLPCFITSGMSLSPASP